MGYKADQEKQEPKPQFSTSDGLSVFQVSPFRECSLGENARKSYLFMVNACRTEMQPTCFFLRSRAWKCSLKQEAKLVTRARGGCYKYSEAE